MLGIILLQAGLGVDGGRFKREGIFVFDRIS